MLLMIDNYDSFTYNLVQYFSKLGQSVEVYRNDAITIEQIEKKKPQYIVISPGPCTPKQAGISVEIIKSFTGEIPILGVCLGLQSIVYAFGGNIVGAKKIMHGKISKIFHSNSQILENIPNPFNATRYHSLVAQKSSLPKCLNITAWTEDVDGSFDEIMGIEHQEYKIYGLQYHPESILTQFGIETLQNFLVKAKK